MKFLQQSMWPDLLFHCFCEDNCFEARSIIEKFHFVSPTLSRFLITKSFNQETLVNKILCSVDPYENHDP